MIQYIEKRWIKYFYGLPKEISTAVMILYKNMKGMVRSIDGNIEFFNIVAGVL